MGSPAAGASFKDAWTFDDVDKAYLDRMMDEHPALTGFIWSIEEIHGKAMMSYLVFMAQRILELHRILKPTGSLYLHCDPKASHYLKIILDKVFGKDNFRNEIAWCYRTGGASKKFFGRKHDIIFFYSKGKSYYFSIPKERSYLTGQLKHSKKRSLLADENGTYQNVRFSKTDIKLYKDEKGYYTMTGCRDYWNIDAIGRTSKERTGYPTQKPLTLLKRIIEASTQKGDFILDPFCGCATTLVAAQQLDRRWMGIDIDITSRRLVMDRLKDDAGLFSNFTHREDLPERTDVKTEPPSSGSIKERLYRKQKGECNACRTPLEIRMLEVDHIVPKSRGGGNYYSNYQLLCGHCNRVKGDRPMEYLLIRVQNIKELAEKISFGAAV